MYIRAEERRFLASCGELRRRAEAAAEEAATTERIFQLAAPAEMRRLCLSINMRRDKATRSFIRGGEWVSGSSGLGPAPVRPIIYHDVSRTFFVLPCPTADRRYVVTFISRRESTAVRSDGEEAASRLFADEFY